MDELEVLAPAPGSATLGGERLVLRPLTVHELPAVTRACRQLLDGLRGRELPGITQGDDGAIAVDTGDVVGLVINLIEHDLAAMVDLVAMLAHVERARLADADLGEFIELAVAVYEVNRDFFVRRLAPLLGGLFRRARGGGPTASSFSSSTATR